MEDNQVTSGVIPTILANVFGFLPLSDLKSVRLVSSAWRDISALIVQRTIVKLKVDDWTLACFLEAFATTPTARLFFRNYWLCDHRYVHEDMLTAFWEKFGPSIHSLMLQRVRMVKLDTVRDILFNYCPNLKSISIVDCYFNDTFDGEEPVLTVHKEIPQLDGNVRVNKNLTTFRYSGYDDSRLLDLPFSWEEIFIAYPNLSGLELECNPWMMSSILEIARCLKVKKPSCLQLQKFRILCLRDDDIEEDEAHLVDDIYSLQLSLKELTIGLGAGANYQKSLSRLLHQQVNVEKLAFYGGTDRIPLTGFPSGVQFKHLRYFTAPEVISDSLGFLQNMPNLSALVLHYSRLAVNNIITRTPINFTEMPLQIKLTSLEMEKKTSLEDVKKLVFWFPGITKAKLRLDDDGFRYICGVWRKLEELTVRGRELTAEGITGISEPKVETRTKSLTDIIQTVRNPNNITCLTNLRQLIMNDYNRPTKLDDICVAEGFLKLPRLNYLQLCSNGISDEGWRKLFNWDQLLTLLPSNGDKDWEGSTSFKKTY